MQVAKSGTPRVERCAVADSALDGIVAALRPHRTRVRGAAVVCVVWSVSALYLWLILKWGWVPHDEGALGQSAERVLSGQLPHRDFAEIYSGGLSYLNALAFELWGTNLVSLRLMLFAFFLAFVPATFYVASRFVSPLAAGAVTLLAAAWSTPMYPAAVPSWYNLFFAVFGASARWDRGAFARPLGEWRGLFGKCFETVVDEPYPLGIAGITLWSMTYFKVRARR